MRFLGHDENLHDAQEILYNEFMGKTLHRREIERLVLELLKGEPTCVMATCRDDVPRASTVEFFPSGTTLYVLTEGGRKVENVRRNPQVSVAVHAPFTGWKNVRGVQITGTAEIAERGSPVFDEGLDAYRDRRRLRQCDLPEFITIIKITPVRIEYIDTSLQRKGFKVRHTVEYE